MCSQLKMLLTVCSPLSTDTLHEEKSGYQNKKQTFPYETVKVLDQRICNEDTF